MEYGNSWEKYPIEHNEIWSYNESIISVGDLTKFIPEYMNKADMIYSDTPWSLQNTNMFNKKAGRNYINKFSEFYDHLFIHIKMIKPKVCFLEIGKQELNTYIAELNKIYNNVQYWDIKYYNKNICYLLYGSDDATSHDYTGMDDSITPFETIKNQQPKCVADFCTGRGLTAIAALKLNADFVGIELNKRKLAVFIDNANKLGYGFSKKL